MSPFIRWLRSFAGVVTILGILVACIVAFGPLVREALARRTWKEVPCEINAEGTRYHFVVNGQRYYSARINFWQVRAATAQRAAGTDPIDVNGVCYINSAIPPAAVLRMDAASHPEQGIGFFTGAGLILAASAFLALSGRRVNRTRAP